LRAALHAVRDVEDALDQRGRGAAPEPAMPEPAPAVRPAAEEADEDESESVTPLGPRVPGGAGRGRG
jgi:hypothetical protein